MSNFRVGQRVVFIGGNHSGGYGDESNPEKGSVYTIREKRYYSDYVALLLVEIVNAPRQYDEGFREADIDSRCFRPVVERKTDISIFTKMLQPKTEEVT